MKLKTLYTMDWNWARRYVKKRTIQHLNFWLSDKKAYTGDIHGIPLVLAYFTPYHHARAKDMIEGKWDEHALLKVWIEEAKKASVIFDVGGYNGIYGLLAKKANPNATVYIFEPDPINAFHIRENERLNKVDIRLIPKAATDYFHDGFINFSGDGSTGSRVAPWGEPVQATMLRDYGSPDLMKIDIEGHEPEALKGADLTNTKTIFAELNSEETENILARLGYNMTAYDRNGVFTKV